MSLKIKCQSKCNVTQNLISLKMEFHSKLNVTLKWNVTQNGISLKIDFHSKLNVTQHGMSLKIECY